MADTPDSEKLKMFESISRFPTLDKLLALSAQDFEWFVGYIFNSAGYSFKHTGSQHFPEGTGVDFDLYADADGSPPIARIEVRRYAPRHSLGVDAVMSFIGKLHLAQAIPGFMVTTSGFTKPAKEAASLANGLVHLVDGDHFLRYIAYIGGSLFTDETGTRRTSTLVSPTYISDADGIQRRDRAISRILTVANNRGGIGKTTAALNLGFALAQQGNRVLMVDMDGQASLTLALPPPAIGRAPKGATPPEHRRFISEFFSGQTQSLNELVQPTRFPHLSILPANVDLQRMDTGGSANPARELAFIRALHDPQLVAPESFDDPGPFEWIIMDTPPAQSYYARSALAACHYMLIPIAVEAFAARGVTRVADTVTAMHGLSGRGVNILGCVITNWRSNVAAERERQNLQNELNATVQKIHLFEEKIPFDPNINVAHLATIRGGLSSIFRLRRNLSPAAEGYQNLLKAVKARIEDVNKHTN
jgi:chromosome partitioning protein